jgi:hypothetical protein
VHAQVGGAAAKVPGEFLASLLMKLLVTELREERGELLLLLGERLVRVVAQEQRLPDARVNIGLLPRRAPEFSQEWLGHLLLSAPRLVVA